MKRRTQTLLSLTGVLLLAGAGLAGAAVAGWLPPVNRWAERRLVEALQASGVQTEQVALRELSLWRARAGPATMRLPGAEIRLEEVTASLGPAVLRGRAGAGVRARGVRATIDLARQSELLAALGAFRTGGGPGVDLEIADGELRLVDGVSEARIQLRGTVAVAAEGWRLAAELTGGEATGRAVARRDADGAVGVEWARLAADPAAWRRLPLLRSWTDGWPEVGRVESTGSVRWQGGTWEQLQAEVLVERVRLDRPEGRGEVGRVQGTVMAATPAQLALDLVCGGVRLERAGWTGELPQVRIAGGLERLEVTWPEARLGGDAGSATFSGTAVIHPRLAGMRRVESARAEVQGLAWGAWAVVPAGGVAEWRGEVVSLRADRLAFSGPVNGSVEQLEAEVSQILEGDPVARGSARLAADVAPVLAERLHLDLAPGHVEAQLAFQATLAAGRRSVRVEFELPRGERRLAWGGRTVLARAGGSGAVTFDGQVIAGRLALTGADASLADGRDHFEAGEFDLRLQWPRLWWESVRQWAGGGASSRWSEWAWSTDWDLKLDRVAVRAGDELRVTEATVRGRGRGAEVFETGGFDLGVTAAAVEAGAWRMEDIRLQAGAGLLAGQLTASGRLAGFPIEVKTEQRADWSGVWGVEGRTALTPVALDGHEPWARLFPALGGLEVSGRLSATATNRWNAQGWTGAGEVALAEATLRVPEARLTMEGLEAKLRFPSLPAFVTADDQVVSFRQAAISGVSFSNGTAKVALQDGGVVRVGAVSTGVFGGTATVAPFSFAWRQPELSAQLAFQGIRLEEVLGLFPNVAVRAEGAIDGAVPVRWQGGRLRLGSGMFGLSPGEIGRMQLPSDMRLITNPEKKTLFDSQWRKVETALLDLRFNRLHVEIYPPALPGQSVLIRLIGLPVDLTVPTPVNFNVNVNDPIEEFMDWTMRGRLEMGGVRLR